MSTELALRDEAQGEQENLVSVIARAAMDPRVDIDKMERLLAMKERMDDQQRRTAFAAAMSRLQAKLPQIDRKGKIMVGTQERSRFARLEDLDAQIRPYLAEEGFAFSYDSAPGNGADIRFIGKLSHREGHFELKQIDMPIDNGGAKSKVQERGSTLTYAVRQLLRMHLNLVMRDEDNDGQGELKPISQKDADSLRDLLAEHSFINRQKFLVHMGVEKIEEIRERDAKKAFNVIDSAVRSRVK